MKPLIFLIIALFIFIIAIMGALSNTDNIEPNIYGEMFNWSIGGLTFSALESGYYYNLTFMEGGYINGFNFTLNNQSKGGSFLTALFNGVYSCALHISGKGSVAGGEYGVGIGKNFQVQRNCYINIDGTETEDVIAISCLIPLVAGDKMNILIDDEASPTKDFVIYSANLNCILI